MSHLIEYVPRWNENASILENAVALGISRPKAERIQKKYLLGYRRVMLFEKGTCPDAFEQDRQIRPEEFSNNFAWDEVSVF